MHSWTHVPRSGSLKCWQSWKHCLEKTNAASDIEVFPAFDYARESHETTILHAERKKYDIQSKTVTFHSKIEKLQLDVIIHGGNDDSAESPVVSFSKVKREAMKGEGVSARIHLEEGQAVSFVLRDDLPEHVTDVITTSVLDSQQHDTQMFWYNWLSKSKYHGGWREVVLRSFLILKMLTYEPTGAIVAAPTFSIPEAVGGSR
jgi:hypothetical protein